MTRDEEAPFRLPADFAERAARVNGEIENGQPMTYQQLANALGLPFEFVAVCCGLTLALKSGKSVVIDPSALPPMH